MSSRHRAGSDEAGAARPDAHDAALAPAAVTSHSGDLPAGPDRGPAAGERGPAAAPASTRHDASAATAEAAEAAGAAEVAEAPEAPEAPEAVEALPGLLGAAKIRELAERLGVRPTKQWGQNFVHDANTVRRIVRTARVGADDVVVEIGPGLGSLTLALLHEASSVTAVEVDPVLAGALPETVGELAPRLADRLRVLRADALTVTELPGPSPTALVANLPYNISVPVILTFLERFGSLERVLVMVQLEVAQRLAARPGSRTFGVPSLKASWYCDVTLAGTVPRSVFWPVPNVDSGLVRLERRPAPQTSAHRDDVFACIDAAFAQRRKTLRAALAGWAGGAAAAETALVAADVDPRTRGEQLDIHAFARLAEARERTSPATP